MFSDLNFPTFGLGLKFKIQLTFVLREYGKSWEKLQVKNVYAYKAFDS